MATAPKSVMDFNPDSQNPNAVDMKQFASEIGGSGQKGGGSAATPQAKLTTTGGSIRGGKISGHIKTDKC